MPELLTCDLLVSDVGFNDGSFRVPRFLKGTSGNRNFHENPYKPRQKSRLNSPKNHIHIDDMMIHNLFCLNSTSFVRYKNNKFQARKLSRFVINLLFLYLTNEVEFGQDIL